ncbi:MAG: hypothetical protein ACXVAU_03740, partial [Mucilaginibacter sp.]
IFVGGCCIGRLYYRVNRFRFAAAQKHAGQCNKYQKATYLNSHYSYFHRRHFLFYFYYLSRMLATPSPLTIKLTLMIYFDRGKVHKLTIIHRDIMAS